MGSLVVGAEHSSTQVASLRSGTNGDPSQPRRGERATTSCRAYFEAERESRANSDRR